MKRRTIAIVGAGRFGTALALRLARAGYSITEIVSREHSRSLAKARKLARSLGAAASTASSELLTAEVIWFCVPDSEISNIAVQFSGNKWKGKIAFHSSGVLTSDAFRVLRKKGAAVASVHPLMTFVEGTVPELKNIPFAVEGGARAVSIAKAIVRDLGGDPFHIRKQDKAAYHAFATMICPLLVSLLAASESTAALAGISNKEARRRMMPIIRHTLANYSKLGPAGAFSGPIVRGDVETMQKHLEALAKNRVARSAYIALAEAALEYLPAQNARQTQELLRGVNRGRTRHNGKRRGRANRRSIRQS